MSDLDPCVVAPETRQLLVRLPEDLHAELKARASDSDLSVAQAVRRAVRQWLATDRGEDAPVPAHS